MRAHRGEDTSREGGFTLLEVVVAVAILGIIIVPLTTALIQALRHTASVASRISDTADAQRIGEAWTQDVLSLDKDGPDVHGICESIRGTEHGNDLISFNSDVAATAQAGGNPLRVVTWALAGRGKNMSLYRRTCVGGVPQTEEKLASHLGLANSDSIVADVVHSTYGTESSLPAADKYQAKQFCAVDGKRCTIVIEGSISYKLEAARRDPGTVTVVQKPPAPVCVSATPGNQLLSVVWSMGATTIPITGFHIEAANSANTVVSSDETGPTSTALNLTGLSNLQDYWVTIYAFNDNGFSTPSNACGPVRPSPTPPGLVGDLAVTPGPINTPLQVNATWTAPADNGGAAVDRYEVQAVDAGSVDRGTWPQPTGLSGAVTGLAPDTKYSVRVRAHNSVGWGPLSDPVDVNTRPPAPTVNNVLAGNGKALVNFTVNNNGDVPLAPNTTPATGAVRVNAICVTPQPGGLTCVNRSYLMEHPTPNAPNTTITIDTGNDTSATPTLASSRTYQFTVELKNIDNNWGPPSAVLNAPPVTNVGPPDVPTRVSIQPWGLSKIVLFRIPPVLNMTGTASQNYNDKVTGFKIKDSRGGITPLIPVDPDNPSATIQLGWLSSDGPQAQIDSGNYIVVGSGSSGTTFVDFRQYNFQLQACNAFGCSAFSTAWRGMAAVPAVVKKVPSISNTTPLGVTTGFSVEPGIGSLTTTKFTTTCYGQTGAAAARVLPTFPIANQFGSSGTDPSQDGTIVGTSSHAITTPTGGTGALIRGDQAWCTTSAINRALGVSFDPSINCTVNCTYNDTFDPGGGTLETSSTIGYVYAAPTPPLTVTTAVTGSAGNKTITFTFTRGAGFDPGGPNLNEAVAYRINGCFNSPDTPVGVTTYQVTGWATAGTYTCNIYSGTAFGLWGTTPRVITVTV